jgi:hypothetical protein
VSYSYNPYAAPQAAPPPAQSQYATGTPQPWGVGEVLSLGFERFKEHWPVLVFSFFVFFVIYYAISAVPAVLGLTGVVEIGSDAYTAVTYGWMPVVYLVQAFFYVGLTRIWLPYLATMLLTGILAAVGFLLLIFPGIYVLLAFSQAPYFVVDAKMGPIRAMMASWDATKGQKGDLFLLGLAGFGMAIVGLLMLCLGVFVVMPIYFVAFAAAFTRISGMGVANLYPGGGGYPQQPGYPQMAPGYGGGYGAPPGYGPPGPGAPPGYGPPPGYGGPPQG